jgi:siroheme synthase (precorrin-2 oxidase/ferrochelatase)
MAGAKVRELLEADAKVRVIAPVVTDQIAAWSLAGRLLWELRSYETGDVRDAFLVVSIADAETNARVFEEPKRAGPSATRWMTSITVTAMHPL